MKKKISIFIAIVLAVFITGCTKSEVLEKKVDLNKTEKRSISSLNFEMPTIFEKSKESTSTIEFYDIEDYEYDYSSCSLMLNLSEIYNDTIEDEVKDELSSNFFQEYEIKHIKINDHDWAYAEAKSKEKDGKYYIKGIYTADYNNQRYSFVYLSYTPEYKSCDKLISKVTNSFKFN